MNVAELADYLRQLGLPDVSRTHPGYLKHLVGVYWELWQWRAAEEVCRAGLFHSIYGTEVYQGVQLPLARRADVRALIGERAEWLAFVNCVMDRASFDGGVEQPDGPYHIHNRHAAATIELTRTDYDDLCRVHLSDWVEQVPRGRWWHYRRTAYQRLAERLGGAALEAYGRVRALEAIQRAGLSGTVT